MESFELAEVAKTHDSTGELYYEFIRADTLSVGLYVLPAGLPDPQQPHTEDEVYYVAKGMGVIKVGDENLPVTEGTVVYVERGVEHWFHSITEDLTILVFFAPPRRSLAPTD
jgi:mannose-6-phosphate isomerase-like protein (cupin superfamily)